MKKAKDFLHKISMLSGPNDFTRNLCQTLAKTVNDSATLSESQQNAVVAAINDVVKAWVDDQDSANNRKSILLIATYINTCHA